jgi:hypothetical protein
VYARQTAPAYVDLAISDMLFLERAVQGFQERLLYSLRALVVRRPHRALVNSNATRPPGGARVSWRASALLGYPGTD